MSYAKKMKRRMGKREGIIQTDVICKGNDEIKVTKEGEDMERI